MIDELNGQYIIENDIENHIEDNSMIIFFNIIFIFVC